jgi:hemoglobin
MQRRYRRLAAGLFALSLGIGMVAAPTAGGPAYAQDQTLYQRLGGYDAIAAVTDDFVGRLLGEPTFERFFAGFSTDSKAKIRQHIVEFVCRETGGPCVYTGRDIKLAHAGIGITKAEWDKAVELFGATLAALNVPEKEQADLAALILPLEKNIVEQP